MTAATMRRRLFREEEPEWLVWLMVLLLLAIGMLTRVSVLGRATTLSEGNVSVSYPASWTPLETNAPGAVRSVGEPFTEGLFPARLTVQQLPAAEISRSAESLGDFALKWSDDQAADLLGYRVLSIEPIQEAGEETARAVRVNYAYVAEPTLSLIHI